MSVKNDYLWWCLKSELPLNVKLFPKGLSKNSHRLDEISIRRIALEKSGNEGPEKNCTIFVPFFILLRIFSYSSYHCKKKRNMYFIVSKKSLPIEKCSGLWMVQMCDCRFKPKCHVTSCNPDIVCFFFLMTHDKHGVVCGGGEGQEM